MAGGGYRRGTMDVPTRTALIIIIRKKGTNKQSHEHNMQTCAAAAFYYAAELARKRVGLFFDCNNQMIRIVLQKTLQKREWIHVAAPQVTTQKIDG